MARIYISGLINTETTCKVERFPIDYYPIDYPFFGVQTQISGVGYNLARAMQTLGDQVTLVSYLGQDLPGELACAQLRREGLDTAHIRRELAQTPSSVVLYDPEGKRQIHCDLKDIQQRQYPHDPALVSQCDIVAACNIGFSRPLLPIARELGKTIATDVHILTRIEDDYNREFLENASIVFLSDEGLPCLPEDFLRQLARRYSPELLVLGRGSRGAMLYETWEDRFWELPCVPAGQITSTIGAGDALFSAFVHFYAKGLAPIDALWNAQIFASSKISAAGGAQGFLTEAEVLSRRARPGANALPTLAVDEHHWVGGSTGNAGG